MVTSDRTIQSVINGMTSDEQKIEETDIRISEDETAESPGDREYIYEIVELLVETISIHRDTVSHI